MLMIRLYNQSDGLTILNLKATAVLFVHFLFVHFLFNFWSFYVFDVFGYFNLVQLS